VTAGELEGRREAEAEVDRAKLPETAALLKLDSHYFCSYWIFVCKI
jgi:hypothetical protein